MARIYSPPPRLGNPRGIADINSSSGMNIFPSKPGELTLSDSESFAPGCLNCINTPCMKFQSSELEFGLLTEFPADKSLDVCPTNSIEKNDMLGISIDTETCISCGLCAARCPVGAIYFNESNKPITEGISEHTIADEGMHLDTVEFLNTREQYTYEKKLPTRSITNLYENIHKLAQNQSSQIFSRLARNLCQVSIGKTNLSRKGDINLRMDGILELDFGIAILEVEKMNEGILDAPRNILDSFAILNTRYNIPKKDLCGIIITSSMPNRRTDYWKIIEDIEKVLDVKIFTMPIISLAVATRTFNTLNPRCFKTSPDQCDLNSSFKNAIYGNIDSGNLREIEPILKSQK